MPISDVQKSQHINSSELILTISAMDKDKGRIQHTPASDAVSRSAAARRQAP